MNSFWRRNMKIQQNETRRVIRRAETSFSTQATKQPTLGYRSCCLMLKGNRRHLVATQLAAAYVSCGISTHQDATAIVGIESAV